MAPVIETDLGTHVYDVPEAQIYISDALGSNLDNWILQKGLRLERLRITAAPEISQATLSWRYGSGRADFDNPKPAPENLLYFPLDLNGKFVKITIHDENTPGGVLWYGVIEVDQLQAAGSSNFFSGQQTFTAYGLLRILERTPITTAIVEHGPTAVIDIGRGLTFNEDASGETSLRSNRSKTKYAGSYIFSRQPRESYIWSAWDAVEYLTKQHKIVDGDSSSVFTLEVTGDPQNLSWWDVNVPTDRRSYKAVLDDLIDRRRGVGYWVSYDDFLGDLTINTFTAVAADLPLPSGSTIKANPDIRELNFSEALDIERATIHKLETTHYHKVVVEGARKTTTVTLELDSAQDQILEDWTSAEEDDYNAAASGEAGYGALEPGEQWRRNARWRTEERLAHVYSRFRLNTATPWNERLTNPEGVGVPEWIDPDFDPLWLAGATFRRTLPLRDRYEYDAGKIDAGTTGVGLADDSNPEYLKPFVIVPVEFSGSEIPANATRWELGHKLATKSQDEDTHRRFSLSLRVLESGPAFDIRVNPGNMPHMFAKTRFTDATPATFDERDDPDIQGGVDYTNARVTIALNLDARVQGSIVISAAPDGVPERTLYLDRPEARLDYVVPYTVVGLKDGQLVKTTSGGYLRDDRTLLEDVAWSAAQWYGGSRNPIDVSFKHLRNIFSLGWLITEIQDDNELNAINTPITAIEYNLTGRVPTTRIETSFFALDFGG